MTTTIPTPILRPIRFVTDVAAWQAFYADLGFISTGVEADGWVVLAADSGRLALHHAEPESPLVGKAKLAWEVPDLEAYRTAVAGTGTDIRRATFDRGDVLVADLPQGRVVIDRADGAGGTNPVRPEGLAVLPLVYTRSVIDGAEAATHLGLTRRITSDTNGWADLMGHGVLAFHRADSDAAEDRTVDDGEISVEISLETGDVEALQTRVDAAGHPVDLIDEAYARTLRITAPDGTRVWVNETQRDLYGFHVATGAAPPSR